MQVTAVERPQSAILSQGIKIKSGNCCRELDGQAAVLEGPADKVVKERPAPVPRESRGWLAHSETTTPEGSCPLPRSRPPSAPRFKGLGSPLP